MHSTPNRELQHNMRGIATTFPILLFGYFCFFNDTSFQLLILDCFFFTLQWCFVLDDFCLFDWCFMFATSFSMFGICWFVD